MPRSAVALAAALLVAAAGACNEPKKPPLMPDNDLFDAGPDLVVNSEPPAAAPATADAGRR